MQVKRFTAETIVQALQDVKRELGPDAIILSTKEERRVLGRPPQYTVVAAVTDNQMRRKQVTEKSLGHFSEKFSTRSASHQKQIISNVVDKLTEKQRHRNPVVTAKRYADISENDEYVEASEVPSAISQKVSPNAPSGVFGAQKETPESPGQTRVQSAVKEAFRSSLSSQFLPFKKKTQTPESPRGRRVQDAVEKFSRKEEPGPQKTTAEVNPEPAKGEQMSWSLEVQPMVSKLSRVGVTQNIIESYLTRAKADLRDSFNKASLEAWVARKILDTVRCVIPGHFSGIEFFVGPQGSGKTTALVKLASEYRLNHKKRVVMVTTDSRRVAAFEQLKVYGRILNIPVLAASSIDEWAQLVPHLENFDNILVDTPGVSLSDSDEFDFLRRLVNTHGRLNRTTHLVLSATSPQSSLQVMSKKFQVAHYRDVIFTNVDQTAHHGALLNFYIENQKPFHSFGLSADIVEGFEWATRERILDLIFKLTKINGASRYESQL